MKKSIPVNKKSRGRPKKAGGVDPVSAVRLPSELTEQVDAWGEKRELKDGEFNPACVQSCGPKAMVFGDLNDPSSEVSRLARSGRATKLLGELGTKPNVNYLQRESWENGKNG